MKQAIVIRTDLGMGKGKIAAQACHASLAAFLKVKRIIREKWVDEGMKKVVVKISGEEELQAVFKKAKRAKLPTSIINDAGLTQLEPGTATAIGIGPADDAKIDKITGKMKLL